MKRILLNLSTLISSFAFAAGEAQFNNVIVRQAMSVGAAAAANSKSVLDLVSTTKGLLPPRMTTTQRDAISSPPTGLTIFNTTTNKLNAYNGTAWAEVGSSGQGGINYLSANPDFENDASGYSAYADAAGAAPVDGTGGSPTTTITRSTSLPLRGIGSGLITHPASNAQGEGVSYAFTIDSTDQAKPLTISFDYAISSGTFVGGTDSAVGDLVVYIYDVTNATVIQPSSYKVLGSVIGQQYKHSATFQAASNSTSYRLIWHIATTAVTAWTFKFDNVTVGPENLIYGAPVSDWAAYTPTFAGLGTPTTVNVIWRRVGDSIQIVGRFTTGTVSGATATISLPSGLSVDGTKWPGLGRAVGRINRDTASASTNKMFATKVVGAATVITFGQDDYTTANSPNNDIAGTQFGSTEAQFFYAYDIPILGWSSNVLMSSDTDARVVAAAYSRATSQSINNNTATTVLFATKDYDTHSAYDTVTGLYTVPVPGKYRVSATIETPNAGSGVKEIDVIVSGASTKTLVQLPAGAAGVQIITGSATVSANAGQTIGIQFFQNSGVGMGIAASGSQYTHFSIERVSGPEQIGATGTVAARFKTASAGSYPNAADTIIDFTTKDFDTHGAVTTGASWKYTAPSSGKYSVSVAVLSANTTITAQQIKLWKNGSVYATLFRAATVPAGTQFTMGGSTLVDLNAGDTIDIRLRNDSGGGASFNPAADENHISIHRIGY